MSKDFIFWVFFHFLWLLKKTVKMAAVTIHCKGSNYPKLSTVLWYNHYLCTLKSFLKKFQSKLSHTCSSNLNYFRKIGIKSFKQAKLARNRENYQYLWIIHTIWSTLCDNWMGAILHHICCTCFTKNVIFDKRKTKNNI